MGKGQHKERLVRNWGVEIDVRLRTCNENLRVFVKCDQIIQIQRKSKFYY